jgi:hypothetical protein
VRFEFISFFAGAFELLLESAQGVEGVLAARVVNAIDGRFESIYDWR